MGKALIIPSWGKPREEIKKFPEDSYAIEKETHYFVNNRYIEKRKRPLFHVVKVTGFIDLEGTFGHSGLRTKKLGTYYKRGKALAHIKRVRERKKEKERELRRQRRELRAQKRSKQPRGLDHYVFG